MISCLSGVNRIGTFLDVVGSSPLAIRNASVQWQTICGAFILPHFAEA